MSETRHPDLSAYFSMPPERLLRYIDAGGIKIEYKEMPFKKALNFMSQSKLYLHYYKKTIFFRTLEEISQIAEIQDKMNVCDEFFISKFGKTLFERIERDTKKRYSQLQQL